MNREQIFAEINDLQETQAYKRTFDFVARFVAKANTADSVTIPINNAGSFKQLGYNMDKVSVENAFADNGVKFEDNHGNNGYTFYVGGEWKRHPHFAALGYVLSKRHYPGFNGSWTDSKFVGAFMKENFGISDFG